MDDSCKAFSTASGKCEFGTIHNFNEVTSNGKEIFVDKTALPDAGLSVST